MLSTLLQQMEPWSRHARAPVASDGCKLFQLARSRRSSASYIKATRFAVLHERGGARSQSTWKQAHSCAAVRATSIRTWLTHVVATDSVYHIYGAVSPAAAAGQPSNNKRCAWSHLSRCRTNADRVLLIQLEPQETHDRSCAPFAGGVSGEEGIASSLHRCMTPIAHAHGRHQS